MTGFYVSAQERQDRTDLFKSVALELIESGAFPSQRVILRENRVRLMVDGYFLLNLAYKDWRINSGHNTETPKIAALTCMAIMTVPPFRPVYFNDAQTRAEAKPNEIFALACASTILGKAIQPDDDAKETFYLRLLDVISEARSETLENYLVDLNLQINKDLTSYRMTFLEADQLIANSLITIFDLISEKFS